MNIQTVTRTARTTAAGSAVVLLLAACGSAAPTTSGTQPQEQTQAGSGTDEAITSDARDDTGEGTETGEGIGTVALQTHADGDEAEYDAATAVTVTLADAGSSSDGDGVAVTDEDGQTVRVSAGGTYILTGTLTEGQVEVDVPEEDDVTIVLDGASISSSTGPALHVVSAEDATVVLADGSQNQLTDAESYTQTEDTVDEESGESVDAPNAALYSTADLTIAGTGELTVTGSANDGITSKDGLVILSGTISVTAADDGIRGKDFLSIEGGTVTVDAAGDGLSSDNTDDGAGIIVLSGEETVVTVASGDDAVKGQNVIDVVGGTLTVTASVEGLESARIILEGGTVDVTSSDDAVNATSDTVTASVEISGGTVVLDAEGDGLDSNGTLTMTGGDVVVNGPTSGGNGSLDVNGEFTVSGGTLTALGTADMLTGPSTDSAQASLVAALPSTVAAGSVLTVSDADGTVIGEVRAAKTTQSLVLSHADLVVGQTYTISVDGTQVGTATAGEYSTATMGAGPGGQGGTPGGGGTPTRP